MITKRKRKVRFEDGCPVVTIGRRRVPVKIIVQSGMDNPKTAKNATVEYMPLMIVLSPHQSAGVGNVCSHARECIKICLDHQGRGAGISDIAFNIHASRIARTLLWYQERQYFLDTMHAEIGLWKIKAERQNKLLCFRPNTFSDIAWELHGVPQAHPDIQWYDYTKNPKRVGSVLPNYWVTFSRDSSVDDATCDALVKSGKNVAVVFDDGRTTGGRNLHGPGKPLPTVWNGLPVVNGDTTDARWTDDRGVVVGLTLKAHSLEQRQTALESGFAVQTEDASFQN